MFANKLWEMVNNSRHALSSEEQRSVSISESPQHAAYEILPTTQNVRYLFRGRLSSSNSGSTSSHCQTPPLSTSGSNGFVSGNGISHQPPVLHRNHLQLNTDSVFIDDSGAASAAASPPLCRTPSRFNHATSSSISSALSPLHTQRVCGLRGAPQARALSLDHFQFELYQDINNASDGERTTIPSENSTVGRSFSTSTSPDDPSTAVTTMHRRSGQNRGNLSLHCIYNFSDSQLEVTILRASDIPCPPSTARASKPISLHSSFKRHSHKAPLSNPYVRLQLLSCPGGRQRASADSSMVTSVKRKTQSPIWNEKFVFPNITFPECQRCSLELVMRDCDKTAKHSLIGRLVVGLTENEVDLAGGEVITREIRSSENNLEENGEIFISLQYLPAAGRLTVDIIKARNIAQNDCNRKPDTFVKVCFMNGKKLLKSKRTAIKRASLNPVYNESFRLNVTEEALKQTTCLVSVYDHRPAAKDHLVGRAALGSVTELNTNSMIQGVSQGCRDHAVVSHWNELIKSPRIPIALWHQLKSHNTSESVSSMSSVDTNSSA